MNILIFAHDCGLRGAERVAASQAVELAERGWIVTVMVPCAAGGLSEFLLQKGINVIQVQYFSWNGPGTFKGRAYRILSNAMAIPKLIKAVRSVKPNIIYIHSIACGVGAVVAKLTKTPRIWQLHETGPCGTTPDRGSFDLGKRLSLILIRWTGCRMLAVSATVSQLWERLLRTTPVGVMYQAVEVDKAVDIRDAPLLQKLSNWAGPKLVVVGSLSALKDQITAVRAMPDILKNSPNAGLFLIGDDHQNSAHEIFATAVNLGVDDHIIYLGTLANAATAIAHADCCVITSVDEGFGRVTVEAMLCGTTVIAADVPVNREVAGDGNANYFEASNPGSLASAVNKALKLKGSEQLDRLSDTATFARQKFSTKVATDILEDELFACLKSYAQSEPEKEIDDAD